LTISKKLVQLMGGDLSVQSELNVGSTFSFTLPYMEGPENTELQLEGPLSRDCVGGSRRNSRNNLLAEAEAAGIDTEEVPNDQSNPCRQPKQQQKKQTVLIAEDDPVSRKIARRMVERAGGTSYEVIVVEDGLEAVHAFQSQAANIDLILMDVQMPNMGGLEATQVIRTMDDAYAKRVPIIALSAGAMKGDRESGLDAGMTDYLTKPVNYKELVATLKKHLLGTEEDGLSQ
jgi:CheY-like chemotaxis protein